MIKYYEESGTLNPVLLMFTFFAEIFLTLILAYFYVLVTYFIPLVYFNIFIGAAFGAILGIMHRFFKRISKNRNHKSVVQISIIIPIFAIIFQWIVFILTIMNNSFPSPSEYLSNLAIIFNFSQISSVLKFCYENGTFSIAGGKINEWPLLLIWLSEAILIILPSYLAVRKNTIFPFSEQLNKWFPKFTIKKDFTLVHSKSTILDYFNEGILTGIDNLGYSKRAACIKIHLYYLKKSKVAYVMVEKVMEGKNGKTNVKEVLLNNMEITADEAVQIMEKYPVKREFIDLI